MHPYEDLPIYSHWRKAITTLPVGMIDPMEGLPSFKISKTDSVATMGSCFAQHVSKHLVRNGFNYYISEVVLGSGKDGHSGVGIFSARYGNVYTVRQARQIVEASFGLRSSNFEIWQNTEKGFFVDSIASGAVQGGFASPRDVLTARDELFYATRAVIEEADVFVYTLGLTEGWKLRNSEEYFSTAPGVIAGEFNAEIHEPYNDGFAKVVEDLESLVDTIRRFNPRVKIILTVSPVALAATHSGKHILVANTLSKSILRVAAESVSKNLTEVYYFPSFDLIQGLSQAGNFYEDDLRTVRDRAVTLAMGIFTRHFTESSPEDFKAATIQYSLDQVGINCDDDKIYSL